MNGNFVTNYPKYMPRIPRSKSVQVQIGGNQRKSAGKIVIVGNVTNYVIRKIFNYPTQFLINYGFAQLRVPNVKGCRARGQKDQARSRPLNDFPTENISGFFRGGGRLSSHFQSPTCGEEN